MPNIYVRLPHYIAAFLRNRDESHPIDRSEAVQIETGDELASVVQSHLMPNLRGDVHPACFSERQWKSMLQGKVIVYGKDGFAMDITRPARRPLTLEEILRLTAQADKVQADADGKPLPDTAYSYEYVPFQLPRTVFINGRELKVQSDFTLSDPTEFVNVLRRRFRRALVRFIALDRENVRSLGQSRSKMESMDRFMLRYDIRYTDSMRETLKKLMNRSQAAALESFDADEDHGRWSREHIGDDLLFKPSRRRCQPILCVTTGETFPSVYAFAKRYSLDRSRVYNALSSGYRIRGMQVRRIENETDKQ